MSSSTSSGPAAPIVRASARELMLVDDAIDLHAKIETMKKDLKEVEAKLEQLAIENPDRHVDLADKDREGKQFFAQGHKNVLPIVITADSVIKEFTENSANHAKISAASDKWSSFYTRVVGYANACKDGKQFRSRALDLLGEKDAPEFVSACLSRDKHGTPKNAIQFQYEDAREIPKEAAAS